MAHYYSEEFKKSAVQKLLSRGSRSVEDLCKELGVANPSIYAWKQIYATNVNMKKSEKRPQDWSAADKLKAVINYDHLNESEQGEFLRREGLHTEHILAWKKVMEAALDIGSSTPATRAELSQLKTENKELKRDLNRKDKALAETTALLVLKKKADLIWGTGENE